MTPTIDSEISEGANTLHQQIHGPPKNTPIVTSPYKAVICCLAAKPGLLGYFAPIVKK